jgi:hypothetical protein
MEDYSTSYTELELALSLSRDGIRTLSDHRQIAEVLNNLGCLSYMGGEIERAMLFFRQSIKILKKAVDFATYSDSKFDSPSTILALSIAKSNAAFLSLTFYRDIIESVSMFESVIKDQQLLLRDAHTTLTTTMEHLAAANLLAGDKHKALQLLRRVLHLQVETFGINDDQNAVCQRTRHKITVLEQSGVDGQLTPSDGIELSGRNSDETKVYTTILPILETSRESSGNSATKDESSSSPSSSSMTNTLKAWRQSNAMTEQPFLANRIIM